jgi:amino acid transporter
MRRSWFPRFGNMRARCTRCGWDRTASAVALLYRRLASMRWLAAGLLVVVLGTIAWSIGTGLAFGHWGNVVAFPPNAWVWHHGWRPDGAFFAGLGSAMLVATYDYWGYYNVTFLGGEARDPGRTIPRAVLLSIAIVAVLYLALNASVLAVMGAPTILAAQNVDARRALLATMMQGAYAPLLGAHAATMLGRLAAVAVMVTAFASVFALLLGYSRIPYAAARDGNFPAVFGRLHERGKFPYVSLLALGAVACVCCFVSLADVIAALVVVRIVLQFGLQQVGVMRLRRLEPELKRPFRIWLYPLPPIAALVGFAYIVVSRANFGRELLLAGVVAGLGTLLFLARRAGAASVA